MKVAPDRESITRPQLVKVDRAVHLLKALAVADEDSQKPDALHEDEAQLELGVKAGEVAVSGPTKLERAFMLGPADIGNGNPSLVTSLK